MGHKSAGKWRIQKDQLVSNPETNRVAGVTRCGSPEETWS
jgi:hypothetical protein